MPILTQSQYSKITDRPYTALYVTSPESIAITAGTPISPSLNIAEISGNLFDYTGGSLKYIGIHPITVTIDGSVSITSTINNIISKVFYGKNGVVDIKTQIDRKIGTGADVGALAASGQFELVTNDTLDFFVDADTDTTLTIEKAYWNIITVD